MCQSLVR
ncbi:hypothetical protein LINPERPRIM_LOCUS40353 [Linum perenne]